MLGATTFPPLPENVGALTVTATVPAVLVWCATARNLQQEANALDTIWSSAQRTKSTCFIRGLKETITIRTNSSAAWRWRRIAFRYKGLLPTGEDTFARFFNQITEANRVRIMRPVTALPFSIVSPLYAHIFRGFGINDLSANPQDWVDPITAPVDTDRIAPLYDKVVRITSGNDAGVANTYRIWHPVNKNLRYNDTEFGGGFSSSPLSTEGRPGGGDFYVIDIIIGNSSDPGDLLDWLPTSTLYWHEK